MFEKFYSWNGYTAISNSVWRVYADTNSWRLLWTEAKFSWNVVLATGTLTSIFVIASSEYFIMLCIYEYLFKFDVNTIVWYFTNGNEKTYFTTGWLTSRRKNLIRYWSMAEDLTGIFFVGRTFDESSKSRLFSNAKVSCGFVSGESSLPTGWSSEWNQAKKQMSADDYYYHY